MKSIYKKMDTTTLNYEYTRQLRAAERVVGAERVVLVHSSWQGGDR